MTAAQPFVRLVLPLVAGILAVDFFGERLWFSDRSLLVFLAFGLGAGAVGIILAEKNAHLRAGLLALAIFCLGAFSTVQKHLHFQTEVQALDSLNYDAYVLKINSLGQKRRTSVRYEATLVALRGEGGWQEKSVKVLVSLPDSLEKLPIAGSQILVKGHPPKRPKSTLNPNEFDYRKYLERKGVAWTVFLPEDSFKILPSAAAAAPARWAALISQKADSVFKHQLKDPDSYGLLKAMVLGRRDDLGADLLNSYVTAGAVHVLAVSGLHVGVFFLLISWILKSLRKEKGGRWLYLLLMVSLLSTYAVVTGLSPSVVRASLMCVTFALSQTFARRHHGLNALAISAFIILIFDPNALFAVGFQLSYAAVLGIILFYPLFKDFYETEILALRWLWQITLISLAAQAFTFPLSIYYFHQFPTYFLLVNPFVIGLTTVLIYSAVLLLLVSPSPFQPLTDLVAYWTDGVAQAMNSFVKIPQRLPNYLLENLHFDIVEVALLLVFMILVYRLLGDKELRELKAVSLCALLFFSYAAARSLLSFNTSRLVMHSVPRHSVVSIKQGQTAYLLADPSFKYDTLAHAFNLKNYLNANGITQTKYLDFPDKSENQPLLVRWENQALGVDAQVFSNLPTRSVIRAKYFPKTLKVPANPSTTFVLSQELGFKTKNQWKALLGESPKAIIDLAETGAIEFESKSASPEKP